VRNERESRDHILESLEDWGNGVVGRAVQLGLCSWCYCGRMWGGQHREHRGEKSTPVFLSPFSSGCLCAMQS